MAFRVTKSRRVWWPVEIKEPQDGGSVKKHLVDAQFEILPQSENDEILLGGQDIMARVLRDFRGFQDEEGREIPFSDEMRQSLLEEPYIRTAFLEAYGQAAYGRASQQKNSRTPRSGG